MLGAQPPPAVDVAAETLGNAAFDAMIAEVRQTS